MHVRSLDESLPRRRGAYRIALTPLADAMFQLLVFFLLASNITPYSVLLLRSGEDAVAPEAAESGGGGDDEAQLQPAAATDTAIWWIRRGTIEVGRNAHDIETAGDLAADFRAGGGLLEVIVVVTETAQVQDIATVLEALSAADITGVRLASARGTR